MPSGHKISRSTADTQPVYPAKVRIERKKCDSAFDRAGGDPQVVCRYRLPLAPKACVDKRVSIGSLIRDAQKHYPRGRQKARKLRAIQGFARAGSEAGEQLPEDDAVEVKQVCLRSASTISGSPRMKAT